MTSPNRFAIASVIAWMATAAYADPKTDAQDHVKKATAAHSAGNFAEALKELTLAYALDPQPETLFAIGQVHMKLGDCASAITFYNRFLDSNPDASDTAAVKKAIARCNKLKPSEPPRPVEPAKPVEPVEPKPVEARAEPTKIDPPNRMEEPPPPLHTASPWYSDGIGDVLVGTGVISGAFGLVMYRKAVLDRDAADGATSYQATQDLLDRSHRERTYSIVATAAGATLFGVGLVHYIVHGRHASEHPVAIVPSPHGGMVTWMARF